MHSTCIFPLHVDICLNPEPPVSHTQNTPIGYHTCISKLIAQHHLSPSTHITTFSSSPSIPPPSPTNQNQNDLLYPHPISHPGLHSPHLNANPSTPYKAPIPSHLKKISLPNPLSPRPTQHTPSPRPKKPYPNLHPTCKIPLHLPFSRLSLLTQCESRG